MPQKKSKAISKARKKKTRIVIVTYNSSLEISSCLKSLKRHKYNVIVVDNNSTDKTVEIIKKGFSNVNIISKRKNGGFSRGVNIGVRMALKESAKFITLLNPDTIVKENAIEKLIRFLEFEDRWGIAGPAIEHESFISGTKQYDLGGNINWLLGRSTHINVKTIKTNSPSIRDYISGCCMVVKAEVFKEIGKLDERFFMYYEDDDFCTRACRAGFFVWNIPKARIIHKFSKSSDRFSPTSSYHLTRSAILFGEKWLSPWKRPLNLGWIMLQSIIFSRTKFSSSLSAFRAIKDTLFSKEYGDKVVGKSFKP